MESQSNLTDYIQYPDGFGFVVSYFLIITDCPSLCENAYPDCGLATDFIVAILAAAFLNQSLWGL